MPYTPPLYNAVIFNFTGTYSPPAYNSVVINFGGSLPPPSATNLPRAGRIALNSEDDWFFMGPKKPAPPATIIDVYPLKMRALRNWEDYDDPWVAPIKKKSYIPVAAAVVVRPVLYTVT